MPPAKVRPTADQYTCNLEYDPNRCVPMRSASPNGIECCPSYSGGCYVVPSFGEGFGIFTRRSKKKFPKPNCVSFDEVVTVKSIPSYTDYSEEVRNKIWHQPDDLHTIKQRNRLEYQAENLNWREAVEEDQMNSCCCMGEKIHPVSL